MLAVSLGGLGVDVGADDIDNNNQLGLVGQLVAEEQNRRADDAHALDHVAHAVRDGRHARQRVEGELVVPAPLSRTSPSQPGDLDQRCCALLWLQCGACKELQSMDCYRVGTQHQSEGSRL